jgi:hypothetical protein
MRAAFRAPSQLMLHPGGIWDGAEPFADFAAWCAQRPGQACNLWVSSVLLQELTCEPDLPLADDAAALEWARGVLQHYHGEQALAWPLASWESGGRRGVSALRGLNLPSIQSVAAAAGVSVRSIRPWWSCVLRLALRRDAPLRRGAARLLVVEAQVVLVVTLQNGGVEGLMLRRLDGAEPAELLRSLSDLPACRTVAVGYGLAPGELPGIECLSPLDGARPPPQWLGKPGA